MFIALSGPASTGKTTLINELKKYEDIFKSILRVKSVEIVGETARKIFEKEFSDRYNSFDSLVGDDLDIMRFQNMIALDQIEAFENKYMPDKDTLYILDRGPLDTMVYTSLNYHNLKSKVVQALATERYNSTMSSLLDIYNKSLDSGYYFCTTGTFDVESDGFRPTSYTGRRASELVAFDMIRGQMCILPDTLDKRVDKILNVLRIDNY